MRNMNKVIVAGGAALAVGVGGWLSTRGPGEGVDLAAVATQAELDLTVSQGAECVALVKKHGQPMADGQGPATIEHDGKTYIRFRVGAREPGAGPGHSGRITDGPNVPLVNRTTEGMQASLCQDPGETGMFLSAMFDPNAKIGDKTVADVNKDWIPPELADPANINDWAAAAMTNDVEKHNKAQEIMARAATLFGLLNQEGIKDSKTVANMYLPDGQGVRVGGVPEFGWNKLNPAYAGKFLAASYFSKTGGCILSLGFNVGIEEVNGGDQRFAFLPCKDKANPSPTSAGSRTTSPAVRTTPPPVRTTPPAGKQASQRPSGVTVKTCDSDEYLGRDGICHESGSGSSTTATSASSSTAEVGKGGSGAGATNTTEAPKTSSPAATVPVTSAPTVSAAKP